MLAPDNEIPVGAVVVRVPPQTEDVELATVRPAGSVSLRPTPVSPTVFAAGLVMVKFSAVVALVAIEVGLKTLLTTGGATTVTVSGPQLLFPSLNSITSLSGSIAQLPPVGLVYDPAPLVLAEKETWKDAPTPRAKVLLAVHLNEGPEMTMQLSHEGADTGLYVGEFALDRLSLRTVWPLVNVAGALLAALLLATVMVHVHVGVIRGTLPLTLLLLVAVKSGQTTVIGVVTVGGGFVSTVALALMF